MCEYEGSQWLDNFHSRIMSGNDPLALYSKARSSQVTRKPKQTKSTEYVYPECKRSTSKPARRLTYLMRILLIVTVVTLIVTTL